MEYPDVQHHALETAFQWRKPAWVVFDLLERSLRVFCGPHEEYIHAERTRYLPIEIVHPDGRRECAIDAGA